MTSLKWFFIVVYVQPFAGVVADTGKELEELTGAHTRVAWVEDLNPKGGDTFLFSNQLRLMGLDSRDGKGNRALLAERGNYCRPVFTPDGRTLLYANREKDRIFAYDWDRGTTRDLAEGYVLDAVTDPNDKDLIWIYAARGNRQEKRVRYNRVVRFPLSAPERVETVWDQTPVSPDSILFSSDLTAASGQFPWPECGVLFPEENRRVSLGRGCWTALAPDDSRLFWIFDGPHRNVLLSTAAGGEVHKVAIDGGEGIDGFEVYHPRWSNDVRILCATGPYKVGQGGNKIHGGGPGVEIHVGRFDANWKTVEKWVRITRNQSGDFYPEVWVSGGEKQTVRAILGAEAEQELLVRSGKGVVLPKILPGRELDPQWPGTEDRLAFVWGPDQRADGVLKIRGQAQILETGALKLDGGALLASNQINRDLLTAAKAQNELTVEAVISSDALNQKGPARIVSFSSDTGNRNFTLGQEGKNLVLRLRTPETGVNGIRPQLTLAELKNGDPVHLLFSYRNGDLRFFLNGRKVLSSSQIRGDFGNWNEQQLIFGAEVKDGREWKGTLDRIAIYTTAVSDTEALQRFEMLKALVPDRP